MNGKGSARRPSKVPEEAIAESFDRIFGITCKRCGKTGLQHDGVHTCSPQVKQRTDFTEWPKEKTDGK